MCRGVSLSWREIPESLIEQYDLRSRAIVRAEGGEREIRFLYRDLAPVLPVWIGNQLTIRPWGNRDRRSKLPRTGWVTKESLELWQGCEPVEIPATFGFDRGIWFQIRQGIRGLLAGGRVYMLTEPASHYYRIMTRSRRMPVLIEERI